MHHILSRNNRTIGARMNAYDMAKQMDVRTIIMAFAVAPLVGACANSGQKQTVGSVLGAAAGGLLGAQFGLGQGQLAATGAGVLLGALIGGELGRTMDDVDRMKANEAVRKAHTAPIGETISWANPDSGNSGTVTPLREGTASSGENCREFEQAITVDGETEQVKGIACRTLDGTWRTLN